MTKEAYFGAQLAKSKVVFALLEDGHEIREVDGIKHRSFKLSVVKLSESEIDKFIDDHDFQYFTQNLPRFKVK